MGENDSEYTTDIKVTDVGEFIRCDSCERRFFLVTHDAEIRKDVPFFTRRLNPLDLILQKRGRMFEDEWEKTLKKSGYNDVTNIQGKIETERATHWDDFYHEIQNLTPDKKAYGREIHVDTSLGAFHLKGNIDFVLVRWENGSPIVLLVECKASRSDQTYHRMQVSLYRLILLKMIQDEGVWINGTRVRDENIKCIVARIDETTNSIQGIQDLEPIPNLEREEEDLRRMLASDGKLDRIVRSNLQDLSYQLEKKCDGCIYNIQCFPESARFRRIELISANASIVRVLRRNGINSIDDLAQLDADSPVAQCIRADPGFNENLDHLINKARVRRKTLPGGEEDPETFPVWSYGYHIQSQLPEHDQNGTRLIRVYLAVEYDYAENRLLALAAHVTRSDGQVHTPIIFDEQKKPLFIPHLQERRYQGKWPDGKRQYEYSEFNENFSKVVLKTIRREWTGEMLHDNGVEESLIHDFFYELVRAISSLVASKPKMAPIHFYVWSPIEMKRLVDACARVNTNLLSHLNELLGCRAGLEQLIYSCVQQEVDRRFALGWTGRGLSVVASLPWFGRHYHWRREVDGETVFLDRLFTQDIFDFKTKLNYWPETSEWAKKKDEGCKHLFEMRSRFEDNLTLPYWHAYWQSPMLPDLDDPDLDEFGREHLSRYLRAGSATGMIEAYLEARATALRWIEENIENKNPDLEKPHLNIDKLKVFNLDVSHAIDSAIDFLQLDHYIKCANWISENLLPSINRVPSGKTIPLRNVFSTSSTDLEAEIILDGYDIDLASLRKRCAFGEGSFVRLSPCLGDPNRGQTIGQLRRGGSTCTITSIDWSTGEVVLHVIYSGESRYLLSSRGYPSNEVVFPFATIDENVSDYVAGRVEEKLLSPRSNHVGEWFDPKSPNIAEKEPIEAHVMETYSSLVNGFSFHNRYPLSDDQKKGILDGLNTRIQLLQGPPGTGKSATTSVAVLMRILNRCDVGDVVLVAAHTHTAVNNLLNKMAQNREEFLQCSSKDGLKCPYITIAKVHSNREKMGEHPAPAPIENINADSCKRKVDNLTKNSVVIIGGTTSTILKMANKLDGGKQYKNLGGFSVSILIVDEASMMVFPHFLALAKLVRQNGEIMLVGDHRQLAPIVAHDWEDEDRPPVVYYQPHLSAFQSILNLSEASEAPSQSSLCVSRLNRTFRLPPQIVELISRIYKMDGIALEGVKKSVSNVQADDLGSWECIWRGGSGIYLVLHSEQESRRYNTVEIKIIQEIIQAGDNLPVSSVAIITPYKAQRSQLTDLFIDNNSIDIIDTVERLQGGERPTVIVSATVSDPSAISSNVEFILNLNRTNVAFTRSEERLIVICSEELINYVPSDLDYYNSALLWKVLRDLCRTQIGAASIDGHEVKILTYIPERGEE
ncbi:hypothetical protein FKB36_08975 [Methanoculleus sp. Afa-1]|uniref:Uncharacterized protein n=1 Tax=Methanoculleus formosensis TaxID=2590886 RepID=A0A9E4ZPP5_9EURY|nr:AAA domain-containing protein [Methanoculleus sp. Afa-1]MCT8337611.1 hypothetical protein [Methanoculleus sp. Afa-1]